MGQPRIIKVATIFVAFAALVGCMQPDAGPNHAADIERNLSTGVRIFQEPGGEFEIPRSANPNDDTLKHYWRMYNTETTSRRFSSRPSSNPLQLDFNKREAPYIQQQMADTPLVSYLLYENGQVVIDEMSPSDRLGDVIDNVAHMKSFSLGKNLAGYLLGHAICRGYIESLDVTLSDWPLVQDSHYSNQTLQSIINMRSRDFEYMATANTKGTNRNMNVTNLKTLMEREFKNSTPGQDVYNYNNINPELVLNYISFKTGYNFRGFLREVMEQHVRLEDDLYFGFAFENGQNERDGVISGTFFATRYDYLRLAIAMLNDWNSDNCVGQYLKTVFTNRQPNNARRDKNFRDDIPNSYGGFFHADYRGMQGRSVMGMDGYPGHAILIDFDANRIVVAHSVHHTYDWKGIVVDLIRTGRLPG